MRIIVDFTVLRGRGFTLSVFSVFEVKDLKVEDMALQMYIRLTFPSVA